jgi:hypothetical protein
MEIKSIKSHLTVTLLLCILLPTGLIGVAAYWFVYNDIMESRIQDVGRIADASHEELRMQLHRNNEHGKALLDKLIAVCHRSNGDINDCVRAKQEQFDAANIDQAEVFAPLNQLFIGLGIFALLFACFAWLVATTIAKSISRPIISLADMAQALSREDFT